MNRKDEKKRDVIVASYHVALAGLTVDGANPDDSVDMILDIIVTSYYLA